MSLSITGIQTIGDRCVLYIDISYNDQIYKWIDYDLSFEQVAAKESVYTTYIDQKELEWAALTPKTRVVDDGEGGFITVDILKEEIVCPPSYQVGLDTSLSITGIQPIGDNRCILYIDIRYNGQIYKWWDYDLSSEQVAAKESVYTTYIDQKELEWAALTPKTRVIESPMGEEPMTVNISKEEIVCPPPDYVALRKAEYPPMSEYLDSVVKGDEAQANAYIAACQAVKEKYPKSYT